MPSPWSRRRAVAVLTMTLALAGCDASADDAPGGLGTDPGTGPTPAAGAIGLDPVGVLGYGRAVAAHPSPAGTTVVTTAMVTISDGDAVTVLDRFEAGAIVAATASSRDGRRIAVAFSQPAEVRTYDVGSTEPVADRAPRTLPLPSGAGVGELFVSTGDPFTVMATTSDGVLVWDETDTEPTRIDVAIAGRAAILADDTLVAATVDGAVVVADGTAEPLDLGVTGRPADVTSSPDGSLVAVAVLTGDDPFEPTGDIVVVDPTTRTTVATITQELPLDPAMWTLGDDAVLVADTGALVRHPLDGAPATTTPSPVDADIVEIRAVGAVAVGAHRNGAISTWRPGAAATVADLGGEQIGPLTVTPGGDDRTGLLTSVGRSGRIVVRDPADDGVVVDDAAFATGEITALAISDDHVALSSTTGDVRLTDVGFADPLVFPVTEPGARVDTVEFVPTTGELAAGVAQRVGELAFDDTVAVVAADSGAARFTLGGDGEDVSGCAFFFSRIRFSPDGATMAVTSHDFAVELVDVASGSVVDRLPPAPAPVLDVAFTPDGAHLVVAADDASVTVWSLTDRSAVATYATTMGGYRSMAMLPTDPVSMATTDVTGAVNVVDPFDGTILGSLAGGGIRSGALVVSPDGSMLAAPSGWAGVTVWSVDTRELLVDAELHQLPITDLAFTTDGDELLTASSDGTVRSWRIVPLG